MNQKQNKIVAFTMGLLELTLRGPYLGLMIAIDLSRGMRRESQTTLPTIMYDRLVLN